MKLINLNGEMVPIALAARRACLPYRTVATRLRLGWSVERALGEIISMKKRDRPRTPTRTGVVV